MKKNTITHVVAFALGAFTMYVALWLWAGYKLIQLWHQLG